MAEGDRKIPRIVRSLGWVSFFTDASSEMIYPLLPALLKSFGAAPIWLGAMEGVAEAVSAFMKWRIGPVVDRAPRKKPIIVAGYALANLCRPLIAFTTAGLHVVFLRSLDRIGKGIRGVPRDALLAESVPAKSLATAFAFHRMMDNAGSVLGPILAFALLRALELPLRVVILLSIVPGLLSLAVLVLGVEEPAAPRDDAPAAPREAAPVAFAPALRRYLFVLTLFTFGASADSFLLLRALDLHFPEAWLPLLWLTLAAAKAASNMPGGWLADRFGRRRTLVVAWLLYAAFYAAMPHVSSPMLFAALVVGYGAYYGLAEGTERAILVEHAPVAIRGRAFAAMHALTGFAVLPANLIFGFLYTRDVKLAFTVSAACAALAAVLMVALVGPPRPEKNATLSE
ncbi:MAG: MFS transporter [Labilithrix sp.]|nr:MFS transporter [Labilithrix sp.]